MDTPTGTTSDTGHQWLGPRDAPGEWNYKCAKCGAIRHIDCPPLGEQFPDPCPASQVFITR